jgi:2-polyprenyl-3-methyl-5-hydroxy-6-metoxy-1,4-benzoquinol methylase
MSGPTGVAPDGSPVALYRKLPGDAEAAFINSLIGERAPVLELGAGAGRITRHLAPAGPAVTAVDTGIP